MKVNLHSFLYAEFAAAAVLVSFCVVIGKVRSLFETLCIM